MSAQRVVAVGLLVVFVATGLLLQLVPGGSAQPASASSAQEDGRLAAFLLLEELGLRPRVWLAAPGELPRGAHLLWVVAAPEEVELYGELDEREAKTPPVTESARRARRLLDRLHYDRFVREGGTLVIALRNIVEIDSSRFGANREFVETVLGIDAPELRTDRGQTEGEQLLVLRDGQELRIASDSWNAFESLEPGSRFERVAVETMPGRLRAREWPFALRVPHGRGTVALLADDRWLDNERIGEADNALLLVRLVEMLRPPGGDVLIDEYGFRGWSPGSWVSLAFGPTLLGPSLHVLALLALGAWWLGRARAFPRDPEPLGQLAPLARARAQAGLFVRAGRFDVLARHLREGVARRLAARTHLARNEELDAATVERALALWAARTARRESLDAWRAAFAQEPVRSLEDLERLARTLDDVDRADAVPR